MMLIPIFPEVAYKGDKLTSMFLIVHTDPSMMSSVNGARLLHTGQIQVTFLSTRTTAVSLHCPYIHTLYTTHTNHKYVDILLIHLKIRAGIKALNVTARS